MNEHRRPAAVLAFFLLLAGPTAAVAETPGQTIGTASVVEWLAAYGAAWETRDADAAAALFTEDATYRENPFEEPFKGRAGIRAYWSNVTADQQDVSFTSDVITVFDRSAVAQWSARFTAASSAATVNLDGVFVLEFDEDGLCRSLREWWIVEVDPD